MNENLAAFPIVDIFAGPGGLGEGFATLENPSGGRAFKSVISIERDEFAHQTLHLRHFLRAFSENNFPPEYYEYLSGKITKQNLYGMYPLQRKHADRSALKISLGDEDPILVRDMILDRLSDATLWALVGGPPCQAYSLVGRPRMKNDPSFSEDILHFLYKEYLSIIAQHSPPIFVMENVKGLLSSKVGNNLVIDLIMKDLKKPGEALSLGDLNLEYKLYGLAGNGLPGIIEDPKEFLVKAENYGVPQSRHRIFIVGVRSDINLLPDRLEPKKTLSLHEVIGDLPRLRSGVSKGHDNYESWLKVIEELRSMHFDFEVEGLGASKLFKSKLDENLKSLGKRDPGRCSTNYPQRTKLNNDIFNLFYDPHLNVLTGHETRGHMPSDIQRYFFASTFAQTFHRTPKLKDFPPFLMPAHKNVQAGATGKMFSDRFRVQLGENPSTTITSHISKDGHYFIHYDSKQSRSLTVREAARAQTFPDNYSFEGPRTSQYHQVGNAVPVYLAKQIAAVVSNFLRKAKLNLDQV